jgi:hypothetical protein
MHLSLLFFCTFLLYVHSYDSVFSFISLTAFIIQISSEIKSHTLITLGFCCNALRSIENFSTKVHPNRLIRKNKDGQSFR